MGGAGCSGVVHVLAFGVEDQYYASPCTPSFTDVLAARKAPGVVNVMQAVHETDGRSLMLQVQAVVLRCGKPTVSLIVHLQEPQMGTHDFKLWLTGSGKVRPFALRPSNHDMLNDRVTDMVTDTLCVLQCTQVPAAVTVRPTMSPAASPQGPRTPPTPTPPACNEDFAQPEIPQRPEYPESPSLPALSMSIRKKKKKLGRRKSALSNKAPEPSEAALDGAAETDDFEGPIQASACL